MLGAGNTCLHGAGDSSSGQGGLTSPRSSTGPLASSLKGLFQRQQSPSAPLPAFAVKRDSAETPKPPASAGTHCDWLHHCIFFVVAPTHMLTVTRQCAVKALVALSICKRSHNRYCLVALYATLPWHVPCYTSEGTTGLLRAVSDCQPEGPRQLLPQL